MRISTTLLAVFSAFSGLAVPTLGHAGRCPNVVIILDSSGSTITAGADMKTRWDMGKAGAEYLINKYSGQLPIGLNIFPGTACNLKTTIPPDYSTKASMLAAIEATSPNGSSPVGTAVRTTAQMASLHDPTRNNYMVLITDGSPGCGGEPDSVAGTVSEMTKAISQVPSLPTYVVGLDISFSTTETDAMNQLATAGGKPLSGTNKYYSGTTMAAITASVDTIMSAIMPVGGCDDSCYTNGCAIGEVCVLGACLPNPCAGVTCPPSSYCYTDGTSPGLCVSSCMAPCPANTRCRAGTCIADPCGAYCGAGQVCNAPTGACVPDPLCTGVTCKGTSACVAGTCEDDPCRFITCPPSTRCVPWEGSCEFNMGSAKDMGTSGGRDMSGNPGGNNQPDMADEFWPGDAVMVRGCNAAPTAAPVASISAMTLAAAFGLLLRRRRARRSAP